jgi:hypothetical protein
VLHAVPGIVGQLAKALVFHSPIPQAPLAKIGACGKPQQQAVLEAPPELYPKSLFMITKYIQNTIKSNVKITHNNSK